MLNKMIAMIMDECDVIVYFIIIIIGLLLAFFTVSDADIDLLFWKLFGHQPGRCYSWFDVQRNRGRVISASAARDFALFAETLRGRVVWVTGASSGIGECLAYNLARVGCKLILSSEDNNELQRVRKNCIGSLTCTKALSDASTEHAQTKKSNELLKTSIFNRCVIAFSDFLLTE